MLKFYQSMSNGQYQVRLSYLRTTVTPANHRSPGNQRGCRGHHQRVTEDDRDVFLNIISGVLESIRSPRGSGVDYLFSEQQVLELLKYEPGATIRYINSLSIWEVTLYDSTS